ncbi:MAG: hypothetical protein M1818_006700 [Claussenomyces sp. TS43310]|nr:MAG: hypothetical protein M1818_006700 [Claussenomyces sp. TS43310]
MKPVLPTKVEEATVPLPKGPTVELSGVETIAPGNEVALDSPMAVYVYDVATVTVTGGQPAQLAQLPGPEPAPPPGAPADSDGVAPDAVAPGAVATVILLVEVEEICMVAVGPVSPAEPVSPPAPAVVTGVVDSEPAPGDVADEIMYEVCESIVTTVDEDPTPCVYVRVETPVDAAIVLVTGTILAPVAPAAIEEESDEAAVAGHTVVVRAMVSVTTTPPVEERAGQFVTVEAQPYVV